MIKRDARRAPYDAGCGLVMDGAVTPNSNYEKELEGDRNEKVGWNLRILKDFFVVVVGFYFIGILLIMDNGLYFYAYSG